MSDMPNYFPPFLRDFHDMKREIKAFYTVMDWMDADEEKRTSRVGWINFHIMAASFIDYLHMRGYRIYKGRSLEPRITDEMVPDLAEMPLLYESIVCPGATLTFSEEYVREQMVKWSKNISAMPEEVQRAWQRWNDGFRKTG